ncbi:RNA-binding protein, predicted [Methanocaldococcus sp. FS406-22]|nr:RNA-binding protein, predicted [Methanocaldococcus sp. FS406-22]
MIMCSCNLYFNGELVMEDVMVVEKKGDKVIAVDLFGERKEFVGEIKKIDLNENKIFIEG